MAKIAIPTVAVMCEDGTTDINVGLNPNVDANDKVQAFVDCFRGCANTVYSLCYRFPVRLALAMWGGESGWATGNTQYRNQNWSNMIYTSMTNPVGNIGSGVNGWAMFEGREHHAKAFAYFFLNNSRYSGLISYLQSTTAPRYQHLYFLYCKCRLWRQRLCRICQYSSGMVKHTDQPV